MASNQSTKSLSEVMLGPSNNSSGDNNGGIGSGRSSSCGDAGGAAGESGIDCTAASLAVSTHTSQSSQGPSDAGPATFRVHPPLPTSDAHIVRAPHPPPYGMAPSDPPPYPSDPLSFFLASGRSDRDSFGFGIGSVADGTFGGRQPTTEELYLFRSHRLLQAEAVSVATAPSHASMRQRFGLVSTTLARQVRMKVLEQTNAAVERVRGLGGCASASEQQDIINVERRTCHRMLSGILDHATSSLRDILGSMGGGTGGDAMIVSGLGFDGGRRQGGLQHVSSSMLASPATESQQLASTWEDVSTSSANMNIHSSSINNNSSNNHTPMQQQQQPPSIVHMPPGMGRSSVFALTQMRGERSHSSALGGMHQGLTNATGGMAGLSSTFPSASVGGMHGAGGVPNAGGSAMPVASTSLNHGGLSAPTPFDAWSVSGGNVGSAGGGGGKHAASTSFKMENKAKSGLLTKIGSHPPDIRRAVYNNRKGSRHRLTPQAKEILEAWLAKHWLNPYPTEDEKVYLAQACLITVTQVNNWMMNVRVRRCRTKKIGVATGPEQITFPTTMPKAIIANRARGLFPSQHRLPSPPSSAPPHVSASPGSSCGIASIPRIDSASGAVRSTGPGGDQSDSRSNPRSGDSSPRGGSGNGSPEADVSGVTAAPWHVQEASQHHPRQHGGAERLAATPAGV